MADEMKSPEKSEAKDPRDVAPVDTRTTMWRVVKLYAWLATLMVAAWGLWLLTAWVYKYPPRPADPLTDACGKLKKGMTEDEACAIVQSIGHAKEGFYHGGSVTVEPATYALYTDANEIATNAKVLCWSWHEQYYVVNNVIGVGERWTSLHLFFNDGILYRAYCEYDYVSHRETVQQLTSEQSTK